MIRKLLVSCCLILVLFTAKSQVYVEGYNINADTTIQYVEMLYITAALSMRIQGIDVGKTLETNRKGPYRLTDAAGKRMDITSTVKLLQHMKLNGWTLWRRDVVFETVYVPNTTGTITGFLLFERANTAPAR
jgi:hypothetical protein